MAFPDRSDHEWKRSGKRSLHGIIAVKTAKCASSTTIGVVLRIMRRNNITSTNTHHVLPTSANYGRRNRTKSYMIAIACSDLQSNLRSL